ncbi:hypothetical protein K4L44_10785 [Halosquirtibacter laminarini]|uniref:Uncharacterized protein n=1 Tax=Halosquirtibacter laminarini TaxID=3374600 RepID=A0AC61NQU5_9BACT|nr:hypothetical protein K4L44_10785 [Prolixibacteraceae bacterium]
MMAIFKDGQMSGLVGSIVRYNINGVELARSCPKKRKKQSPKQLTQQLKMKITMQFLRGIKEVVHATYPTDSPFLNGHVQARSSILRNAFSGDYPTLCFHPSKVELSSNPKRGIRSIKAQLEGTHLDLWVDLHPRWSSNDLSLMVIHAEGEEKIVPHRHSMLSFQEAQPLRLPLWAAPHENVVQHFWIMLYDTFGQTYYRSCYLSLTGQNSEPKEFRYVEDE